MFPSAHLNQGDPQHLNRPLPLLLLLLFAVVAPDTLGQSAYGGGTYRSGAGTTSFD